MCEGVQLPIMELKANERRIIIDLLEYNLFDFVLIHTGDLITRQTQHVFFIASALRNLACAVNTGISNVINLQRAVVW